MTGETDRVRWRGVRPIDGIAGVWPDINSERVNKQNQQSGDTTELIYTVPANKKLYISNVGLSSQLAIDADCRTLVYVRDDNDVTQYQVMFHQYNKAGQQSSFVNTLPALEALAGWDIMVEGNNDNMKGRGFIFGWLEEA